jgi:hypothetical protein
MLKMEYDSAVRQYGFILSSPQEGVLVHAECAFDRARGKLGGQGLLAV